MHPPARPYLKISSYANTIFFYVNAEGIAGSHSNTALIAKLPQTGAIFFPHELLTIYACADESVRECLNIH